MLMRVKVGVLSAVLVTACASGVGSGPMDATPTDVDPTGSYTLTTHVQGSPVYGQMRIRSEGESYSGVIYTDVTGEIPITSLTVQGNEAVIEGSTPNGPVDIEITFDGDAFAGVWRMADQGGTVQGRRVSR